ncbi:hypothetical protein PILCRDRAFT_10122 [Piloderma croceum F 1598]|uniref:Uncharacterized protein n=1 Tax=Piloderma croceum (strain F 1598) TaxID=765440 RepID=A0A0C3FIK8_PILCF|nr:hypothetical protein PILCRDRAFT_10122 [Piloderma croceum F 1598]
MFCRNKRESDDKKLEENVQPSLTEESTTATSAPMNGRTSTPSPSESAVDQSDPETSDIDSGSEGRNSQPRNGIQETNGHAKGEIEKTGCPKENGNGPLSTVNGQANGRQSPPDNASESREARVDSPEPTIEQTRENAELGKPPPANDGGVRRKRRRKAKGKGNFPIADGQSPSGLQEPQGDSSRPGGKGRRNRYRRTENGGVVDRTGTKNRRRPDGKGSDKQ